MGARRRASGVGIAGVLAWGLACAGESPKPAPATAPPTLVERAAELLGASIRIRTVNPPGDERPLAQLYVDTLRSWGIEAEVISTPPLPQRAGGGSPRAAAWGRLRGLGDEPAVVLLSHLDVVPADPAEWSFDPFAGARDGDRVLGRGAIDAKGVSVVHLLAMAELRRRDRPLARDVIFLATPDEENGGRDGAGYLVTARPDLFAGASTVLTEGGGIRPGEGGSPAIWGVAVTEKSPCWLRLAARGTAGHSSVPDRDAPVARLVAALDRVRRIEPPLRVVPEVQRMFAAMAPLAKPEDAPGYADLSTALARDVGFRHRFLADRRQAALVRDTVAITVLEGGPRTNVMPAEAFAHVDARLLPGERCDDFAGAVRAGVGDLGVEVAILLGFPSRSSSADTPMFRAIERVAAAEDPGAVVVPRVLAGFTDAHWFRDAGLVAYGFVPRRLYPADARGVHGIDEHASASDLARATQTLLAILE